MPPNLVALSIQNGWPTSTSSTAKMRRLKTTSSLTSWTDASNERTTYTSRLDTCSTARNGHTQETTRQTKIAHTKTISALNGSTQNRIFFPRWHAAQAIGWHHHHEHIASRQVGSRIRPWRSLQYICHRFRRHSGIHQPIEGLASVRSILGPPCTARTRPWVTSLLSIKTNISTLTPR